MFLNNEIDFSFSSWQNQIVRIAPEYAQRILNERSGRNRQVNEGRVAQYMRDMQSGKFSLSPDPITFDRQGLLRSGQHRLRASVKGQVSFDTRVVVNQSEEVCESLDIGRARRLGDVLEIDGVKYSNESASMVSIIQFIEDDDAGSISTSKYSLQEKREVYARHEASIKAILETNDSSEYVQGIGVAPVTGALAWAYRYYPQETLKFAKQYLTGLMLTEAMPANALRKSMLSMHSRKESSQSHRTNAALHTLSALRAEIEGVSLKKFKVTDVLSSKRKLKPFFLKPRALGRDFLPAFETGFMQGQVQASI